MASEREVAALQRLREVGAQLAAGRQAHKPAVPGRDAADWSFRPIPQDLWPPAMRNGGIERDFAAQVVASHEAGAWVDPSRLAAARRFLAKAKRTEPIANE